MFYKYGVDIILEAHEHSYERLWPVYNEVVTGKDYINPKAPIHLISGTAGCSEGIDPTLGPRGKCEVWCTLITANYGVTIFSSGPWSAYRSWWPTRHGYGRLHVVNSSHTHWEQVIADDMRVEDEIWIVQENHGPFPL